MFILGGVDSMGFDKSIMTCIHNYSFIWNSFTGHETFYIGSHRVILELALQLYYSLPHSAPPHCCSFYSSNTSSSFFLLVLCTCIDFTWKWLSFGLCILGSLLSSRKAFVIYHTITQ